MALSLILPRVVPQGGYEYEFVEEVPDKLQCMICTKPLRDPHLSGCCGQHFCHSCLQQCFRKQKKEVCPHCRTENFPHLLNKERQREIAALKVYCTCKTEGCQWMGELSNLDNHLEAMDGCGFVLIECTSLCDAFMVKKDLQHHLTEECRNRMYQCEHCGHRDTYGMITEGRALLDQFVASCTSHYAICEHYPLQCPNKCGAEKIKRKDMAAHRDKCPREELECHFHKAGCTKKILRCNFDKHMEQNTQQHLLLMMKELTRISQENERILKENERISEENKSLKAEMAKLKRKK